MTISKDDKANVESNLRIALGAGMLVAGVASRLLRRFPERQLPIVGGTIVATIGLAVALKVLDVDTAD